MTRAAIDLQIDTSALGRVRAAMAAEADGRTLSRQLTLAIKIEALPIVEQARRDILTSGSATVHREPIREAIANAIRTTVSLKGTTTGVKISAPRGKYPRGFRNAPGDFNRRDGWRHPVFGSDTWELQVGQPYWFDDAPENHKEAVRAAVLAVVDAMAERIALRSTR